MGDIEKKSEVRPKRRGRWVVRQGSDGRLAPFGAVYIALLGLGTLGALAVYLLLVAFVPGASGTRLDAMKTALLVVAGSGAGAGLYMQYRKQQTDEAKSALDHANSRRDQDKLFTERYTQAVAQLGNTGSAAVRLGGVYALARIADDSERDRPTCLKVMCAYLRMPYDPDIAEPAEREVRATVQTAIVERLRPAHPGFWPDAQIDLTGAYLIDPKFDRITADTFTANKVTFSGVAVFDGATFRGDAGFDGATFSGPTSFGEATFSGPASFGEATFSEGARFGGATFSGFAWFRGATFSRAALFIGATFTRDTVFAEATFSRAALFVEARFRGTAGFIEATFSGSAEFAGATISGIAGFAGATFSGPTSFGEGTFSGPTSFAGATFSGPALFGEATFSGPTSFTGARFSVNVRFGKATFSRAHLPEWPDGFAEPAGIVWDPADPPAPAPDPDLLADPAGPRAVP